MPVITAEVLVGCSCECFSESALEQSPGEERFFLLLCIIPGKAWES